MILKGYFDESGDANDVNETSVSVAGYLGPVEAWDHLESEWQSVLKKFDVPCLHMFQLKARSGPFSKWTKGLDRMTKPQNVIATATEYFSTDRRHADWMAPPTLNPCRNEGLAVRRMYCRYRQRG